jgi:transcriptional regulator with XRE-family HTH domain
MRVLRGGEALMPQDQRSSTSDFGDLLLRFRLAAGLSREALAERAGLSATGIGALERGQRRAPHADTVRRLSEALKLSSDDAAALAAAVVRHRAPNAPAPAATLPVTNSPALIAPLGPLVGRGWDVAVVCGLLRANDTRFVTLTGPAGVGKTRLALAVAEHLARELPEPVVMVDLAPVRDPDLVLQALLAQFGLRETGDRALERLVQVVQKRRVLILVDNFEQVMPAAGELPRLLAEAPELRLLVTSRSPLGLRSEHVYPVPALELPDLHRLPPVDELAEIPAVTLFLTRGEAVSSTFKLTDENARTVAELCVRLDGLPLAIKLAAARMQVLSPKMILDRLEHRLSLLHWDARDCPNASKRLKRPSPGATTYLVPRSRRCSVTWLYSWVASRSKRLKS